MPQNIVSSKTEIGIPISELAKCLRGSGILRDDCLVYFKIDQHEEVFELERKTGLEDVFRKLINKALAGRDPSHAYRIGTRHYSWTNNIGIWGTTAVLEEGRDYSVIDIDRLFGRKENPGIGDKAFRSFCEDVFKRRLKANEFCISNISKHPIRQVFGQTPSTKKRAMEFATPISKQRYQFPDYWSPELKSFFCELRESDPLDAKLGEAWLRQKSQLDSKIYLDFELIQTKPWQSKLWWKKERNEVAIMQLAAETSQNLSWWGERHIVDLSGGNILAFMSICRFIWSSWIRKQNYEQLELDDIPKIGKSEQKVGIYEASTMWVEKLREGQFGDRRQDFVMTIGSWLQGKLKSDKSITYPGHNGFSILRSEFMLQNPLTHILQECRDYGSLRESDHTSKERSGRRVKWYLNPILCPYFGIPHVRTKEPVYTSLVNLEKILSRPKSGLDFRHNEQTMDLFDNL